jgi:hypothetical protein
LSTWSGTTRTHAHFSSLSLPPYFGNNNNSLLRSSLPRSSRVSLIRPPLLRLLLLISTVCNATAFSQARRVHAQQALLGAGRDNSTHKERHDGKLLLLPAELLVYWRLSTYQSLRERNTFVGRQRQQGQLCHNSWRSQLHSLVPNCSAGAAGAAPALPFAAPLLRTTNESAAISAVWADTHELETRYPKRVVCVLSCRVSFGPLRERVSRPVLGFGVVLGFWPVRAGLGRFMSGLGLVWVSGRCAGWSGPVHV